MDTIYIIGAGAIGKALAVFLKQDNKKVVLLRGSVDDQSAYTESITVVSDNTAALEATIQVNTLSNFGKLDGIIVLTNKSYGNEKLAQALKGKTGNSPVVILQNGLGVEQAFVNNGFPSVYRCVLFVTSQVIAGNQVRFKPVAISPIGIIQGNATELHTVVTQLNSARFQFSIEHNIQAIIWKKAIVNSVFNSVCPLLDIDNGVFHREEKALIIAKRVIAECVAIAMASGVVLSVEEVEQSLLLISKLSDGQLISTLQDIKHKRPTEIDTLNFAIVAIARELNKEHMVQETKLLGELTKLKSQLSL